MPTQPVFQVGERVKLISTGEVGIVVHAWWEAETDGNDYYVAFFGESFPISKPEKLPYVLRYGEPSLESVKP
jgi:hypothetical protein